MAISSHNGKNFRNRDFRFKIRFGLFWIDSDQKKISTKNFCLCHFFDLWPHFSKKWLCQVIMGKNFRNRDFRFKIRFGPFWIDSDQKNFFDQKFLSLPFFRPGTPFFEKMAMSSHNGKNFRFRDFRFKIRFGPFWIDYDQKKNFGQKFLSLPFFDQKWPKIEVFWRFLVEKFFCNLF